MFEGILRRRLSLPLRLLIGFAAGVLATLTFHQIALAVLSGLGALPAGAAYSTRAVPPLGVPQVLNIAFWGGVWGVVWALVAERIGRRGAALLVAGFLFGAILPTLVAWFVVAPLKGQPVANGWNPARLWIGPVVNGVWGLGAALVFDLLSRWAARRSRLV